MTREVVFNGTAGESVDTGDYIVRLAFASEIPYERWWGIEILDCSVSSVRLARINDGAPVLYNHNWDELRGTHIRNSATCDADKVVRADVKLTSATEDGRETIGLVKSEILTKVSVGYQIHAVIEQTTTKDGRTIERQLDGRAFEGALERFAKQTGGRDVAAFRRSLDKEFGEFERAEDQPTVYRVIDWEPYENSLVTIPADNSVGVGRSAEAPPTSTPIQEKQEMSQQEIAVTDPVDIIKVQNETRNQEQKRASDIIAIGEQFLQYDGVGKMAQDAVRSGESVEIFRAKVMDKISSAPAPSADLGLSAKEQKRYSLMRAILALTERDWSKAGFEKECHEAIMKRAGLQQAANNGFYVPYEVQKRDMTAATANAGGYLVATDNLATSFIDLLRNRSVLVAMGARMLTGLVGNVTIPKQTGAGTAYWLANEATSITEGQQTLGQLALTPKNVGAYTEISRQLMLQSDPSIDALVMDDLAKVLALAIDLAGINGSGSGGQPTGIIGTSGIGSVTGTTLGYAGIVEFQTDVAGSNALAANCGYVTTPAVAGLLKQRQRFSSTDTPLWQGNILDGEIEGFKAMSSLQVPSANMLFGDFSQVIIGEWGMLEIALNPYANFAAAISGIRAIQTVDIGVRIPGAFSLATSIT